MLLCSSLRSLRVHSAPLSRTLFSLPNLPSFSPFGSSEQTFKQEKKFRYADHTMLCYSPNPTQLNLSSYTDRELYAVVADVASYPKFIPFCVGSRISPLALQQAMQQKTTAEAELTVGFMQFKESYVSNVTCVPFESVQAVASSSTPLFKNLSTTWRFSGASQSTPTAPCTMVSFDLTYEFANPLHAGVSSAFFGQVANMMIQAFEDRCATVYGSRPPPRT
ncbi:dehydrase and lipid transport-domain-containing protein [Panaeolus papilionaceus]|nr:dehydrase and lipid transport-domain-containing protein [Panaeolus papilionaceus]